MYPNLNVRVLFLSIYTALFSAVSCCVYAEETELPDSVILEVADTLDPDPEWYVAPLSRDSVRAGKRALVAAATCTIDSVQIFNVDSVLTGVSVYEYGDTTRTMTWTVNSDGSRFGTSRSEEKTTGDITFTASYEWDAAANDWKGISKEEHTFAGSKETLRTSYDWQNGAWSAKTQYTWAFDASAREIEYTTYSRNDAGALAYSEQRLREYNAAGKLTQEIQYTAHNGTDWSAGTKKVYDFDTSNNQVLYEYYSTYTNGAWVGSSKEIWTYTAGKKTYYEKNTWSNGSWVKNTKEVWVYNAVGKELFYEKYGVNNNEWAITNQNNSGYNEYNNLTHVENYTFNKTTGVKTGAKKEDYTLKGSTTLQLEKIQYKWVTANADWANNIKTVKAYNDANKIIDDCTYNWINDEWVGVYTRTKTTYSGSNATDVISMSWSADINDWVNSSRTETEYTGSNKTKETNSIWQDEAWFFTGRTDYHYTAGKNDTTTTYTCDGVTWTPLNRTVNTFNAAGTNIMTHIATWSDNKWALKSMTKTDLVDHVLGGQRQTLSASWKCGSDSVWTGVKKDTVLYSATGKTLYTASYKGWENNDWKPASKSEFFYDEQDRKVDEQTFKWNNGWVGNIRNEYGYDDQGRSNMSAIYVGWNSATNWWIGSTKTLTTFKADGKIDYYVSYKWGTSDWVYNYRYNFTYDGSGNEIGLLVEEYKNNNWENKTKTAKEYKGNTQVKNNTYSWLNNQWVFSSRNESYYDNDAQAKLRREVTGLWNSGILQSFTDNHYFYACDPKSMFTIRFVNENGATLESKQVQNGTIPAYSGETPTKESTAEYTYTFVGWDKTIAEVSGDATYTAVFTTTKRQYTVTWLNEDGSEIDHVTLEYGAMPTHADATKEATAEYTYAFAGWGKEIALVTGNETYQATFTATKNSYTITWLNEDGSEISHETLEYGLTPEHANIYKESTAEYTYTFAGWDKEITPVNGDATYKAVFTTTKRQYTVTWLNEDGTEMERQTLEYGAMPQHADATKASTAEYTYTFAGWDKEIASVTGDETYQATFNATKNSYTITWLNEDGSELDRQTLEYGAMPQHADATKASTAEYTYTFAGWDKEIASVTGDETYQATFNATKNSYTITWLNEDGSELDRQTLEYGAMPQHTDPSKESTAEYTYAFAGWDKELVAVEGDAIYTAIFTATKRQYTITWLNSDNSPLYQEEVEYGETPVYTGETPTQESTAEYTYTFAGWDSDPSPVTGAAIYKAVYSSNKNSYTVTFYFEDGVTVLDSQVLEYGETPGTSMIPSKNAEEHYYYTFAGWYPEITPVTGNVSYTPVFTKEPKQYTITFKNYNGRPLWTTTVPYGETPVYNGETPTRPRTQQYSYEFAGWSPELTAVSGDATYTALFDAIVNQYTVVFQNEDGTELDRQMVDYGTKPEYQGETPTKEPDENYRYEFAGWTPRIAAVYGDATYTATYTRHDLHEGIDNVQSPCMEAQKVLRNGTFYILRGGKTYTLDGVLVE